MGWLFGFRNTTQIKNELNAQRGNLTLVDQKMTNYGRHIWSLYQTPTGERFINLDLCQKQGEDWGYKDMDETMGPYYYDCPLDLIRKAGPAKYEDARKWRELVEQYHARRSRKLTVGTKVRMYGHNYDVIVVGRQKIIRREDGRVFSLSRRNMADLEIVG